MKSLVIEFLGHASFLFTHPAVGSVFLDPWLSGNPACRLRLEDVREASYVAVTHGHRDHLGDAIPICLRTGATLVAAADLCAYAARSGVPYGEQSYPLNIGGTLRREALAITMVHAIHAASIQGRAYQVDRTVESGGQATGFIFAFEQEFTIYATGDTGVFGDMKLFAELYQPDLVILPIGGQFTMGPREALRALELMQPRYAIPCHFQTGPTPQVDVEAFAADVRRQVPQTQLILLQPGECWQPV
ncbi:MAG TPA: metal-dependent hydrolase [Gemmatales bacterium]|nr:metal-dependent hydrolase [Gemmatales bacterium]HMP57935.1 metal-dependent hydrolase [Gemmatales bacterium]